LTYDPSERSRVLDAYFESQVPPEARPEIAIHGDDFMFRFFLAERRGHRESALVDYFHSGWTLAQTVRDLLGWARPGWTAGRILDFAAGFGRGTRYLARLAGDPARVWMSDLFPAMVEFQTTTFGVHGFASTALPEDLEAPAAFDAIVVSSLFSHLPADTFERWLGRLGDLLAVDGVLVFSVHGEEVRPSGTRLPAPGILFEGQSEIPEIGAARYGTSWVSEEYVGRAIAAALPSGFGYRRFQRALWAYQDAYLVGAALPEGEPPTVGHPVGFPDLPTDLASPEALELSGWAADLAGREIEVRLAVEGEVLARVSPGLPRSGVVEFLRDDRFDRTGFGLRAERPGRPFDPGERVLLEAAVPGGTTHVLACDTIEGLLAQGRQLQQQTGARSGALQGGPRWRRAWPRRLARRLAAWRASGPSVE
jgi:SAM-dependent methyltransferase